MSGILIALGFLLLLTFIYALDRYDEAVERGMHEVADSIKNKVVYSVVMAGLSIAVGYFAPRLGLNVNPVDIVIAGMLSGLAWGVTSILKEAWKIG